MPDGNGLDLLREIKSGEADPAVIMMTAYTSTKSAIEAMKLGAADYISKPFDVEELKIVAQKAEWEVALGDNPRLVASYVQPELRLVETWGKQGWADGEHEVIAARRRLPGILDDRPSARRGGEQRARVGNGDQADKLAQPLGP